MSTLFLKLKRNLHKFVQAQTHEMDGDDLLTFKEFEVGSSGRGGSAQININSPKRTNPYGEDHLQDLINDMSASAQVMGQSDRQNQPQGDNSKSEIKNI